MRLSHRLFVTLFALVINFGTFDVMTTTVVAVMTSLAITGGKRQGGYIDVMLQDGYLNGVTTSALRR